MLVIASVLGVIALLQSNSQTQVYWAAREDITPGATLTAEQFVQVEANLAETGDRYLRAEQPAPDGSMVVSTVRAGELVPRASLAEVDPQRRQLVGIAVPEPLAQGVNVGDRVDVWVALPQDTGQGFQSPDQLATGIEIAEISVDQGGLTATNAVRIQLLADPDVLPELLAAKVQDARITMVPTLGGH
ncbi:MAG: flagellar biosynthesis protein FlgA [Micrococcus sp.]|nr:flagellar biosynthesis protein FlgA [Micrococcus sp.]